MAYARRSVPFETPDLRYKLNYSVYRLPQDFQLSIIQPAKRFLRLIQDQSTYEFLKAKAEFEVGDDDRWMPHLHLGSGSWGSVGCWIKTDEEGSVIDQIAVKQLSEPTNEHERAQLKSFRWDPQDDEDALLTEAVIQKQLNLSLSESELE